MNKGLNIAPLSVVLKTVKFTWYQAIAMGLRCHGVAQSLGERHNRSSGITPLEWLDHFGTSLNRGSGLKDINRPLPLICRASPSDLAFTTYDDGRACPSLQNFLELSIQDMTLEVPTDTGGHTTSGGYACRLRLLGNAMSRPPLQLGSLGPCEAGGLLRASACSSSLGGHPSIYPIDQDLSTSLLVVEVGSRARVYICVGVSVFISTFNSL